MFVCSAVWFVNKALTVSREHKKLFPSAAKLKCNYRKTFHYFLHNLFSTVFLLFRFYDASWSSVLASQNWFRVKIYYLNKEEKLITLAYCFVPCPIHLGSSLFTLPLHRPFQDESIITLHLTDTSIDIFASIINKLSICWRI